MRFGAAVQLPGGISWPQHAPVGTAAMQCRPLLQEQDRMSRAKQQALELIQRLPDDVAAALRGRGNGSLPRRMLEALAVDAYQSRELTRAQVRRLLGFEHRLEVDAFLKKRGVPVDYTPEDLEEDREVHRALGLR